MMSFILASEADKFYFIYLDCRGNSYSAAINISVSERTETSVTILAKNTKELRISLSV